VKTSVCISSTELPEKTHYRKGKKNEKKKKERKKKERKTSNM